MKSRCDKCGHRLIEEVGGIPLGFLSCPKCKCAPDEEDPENDDN
jgi:phage FluMu protein Com